MVVAWLPVAVPVAPGRSPGRRFSAPLTPPPASWKKDAVARSGPPKYLLPPRSLAFSPRANRPPAPPKSQGELSWDDEGWEPAPLPFSVLNGREEGSVSPNEAKKSRSGKSEHGSGRGHKGKKAVTCMNSIDERKVKGKPSSTPTTSRNSPTVGKASSSSSLNCKGQPEAKKGPEKAAHSAIKEAPESVSRPKKGSSRKKFRPHKEAMKRESARRCSAGIGYE